MPKPFTDRTGSGLHMHLSLWHDGGPAFPDADDAKRPGTVAGLAYSFVAGHARARLRRCRRVLAPTVNSYKRTGATSTR